MVAVGAGVHHSLAVGFGDQDGDGIQDQIDAHPTVLSKVFSDGTTFGEIISLPAGVAVQVVDETPNPDQGVRITATGTASLPGASVEVSVCGLTVITMVSPSNFVATCSSVTIQVESGSITATTTVSGKLVTITVGEGGGVTINLGAGTLENIGETEIEVTIDGGELTLELGDPPLPLVPCADVAIALQAIDVGFDTELGDKVGDAITLMETCIQELSEEPPDTQEAVEAIEEGVEDLEEAHGLGQYPVLTDLMEQLAETARQLVGDALDAAAACDPDHPDLTVAQQAFDEGDYLTGLGQFKDAVNAYKEALSKAEGVLSSCHE